MDYFKTASLNAFAARRRTTVLALILIASPVAGLRPMRALRCAFTARPIFGITNLPAPPLHSLTARLKSSSKNWAAVFFDVPHFSAMLATTLLLVIGLAAIEFVYPPEFSFHQPRANRGGARDLYPAISPESAPDGTIANEIKERKEN